MKIYVSHSRNFDYQKELYTPLLKFGDNFEFIFPHQNSRDFFNTKKLFQDKGCDLVLAEVSYPATGQGIELGWANMFKIPIVCVYKKGFKFSGSLKTVTDKIFEYKNIDEVKKILHS